jgi:cobalt-zinc-cadmium efflux system outer membrane protein
MMPRTLLVALLAAGGLVAGCVRAPRDAGFDDVRRAVRDRTGRAVEWNARLDDDGAAVAAVREMLQRALSADDAVQIALLNNRRLQAVYEDLGVACAELVQAGLLRNPVFEGQVRGSGGASAALELSVVQDFLSVVLAPLKRRIAAADLDAAKSRVTAAVLDLAWETRTTFTRLQADVRQLALHREMLEAAGAAYQVAQRLHQAGNITDLDLAREQALHEEVKLAAAAAELAVEDGRERIHVLLGLHGQDTAWTPSPLPDVPQKEVDLAGVERRAIEASLDVEIARKHAEAAARRLGVTRVEKLFEGAAIGTDAQREGGDWSAGPLLAMPIPLFDRGQGHVAAAQAELRRRWRDYAATAVEVRSAARAARNRLVAARQRVEYYARVVVPLRARITAETLLEYNAMQIGPIQLLEARRAETEAQRQGVESLRDYWVARAEMEQVLNGRMPKAGPAAAGARAATAPSRGSDAH